MRKFKVTFRMPNIGNSAMVFSVVEFTGSLGNIRNGFWIDGDGNYVGCADEHSDYGFWFVPAAQIVGIVRA